MAANPDRGENNGKCFQWDDKHPRRDRKMRSGSWEWAAVTDIWRVVEGFKEEEAMGLESEGIGKLTFAIKGKARV